MMTASIPGPRERCPNCFRAPLNGWQRIQFSIDPTRHGRRVCGQCGARLRIRPATPVMNLGKFVGPLLFIAWIVFDAFDTPLYWAVPVVVAAAVLLFGVFRQTSIVVELDDDADVVELDDDSAPQSLQVLRQLDED